MRNLKGRGKAETEGILADVVLALLPDPSEHSVEERVSSLPVPHQQLLKEVRKRLRTTAGDYSAETLEKLYTELSSEISRVALADSDTAAIKRRLGERGELRPDLYQVEFPDTFDNTTGRLGIRRNHIIEGLRRAYAVQHLNPDPNADVTERVTFSASIPPGQNDQDRFTLLIQFDRIGDTMRVIDAWRLYHSDLEISEGRGPIELFSAFLDRYGVALDAGGLTGKLFLYEIIDAPPADVPLLNWVKPAGGEVGVVGFLVPRPSALYGKLVVVVGYAYNLVKYVEDIRKHHVFFGDVSDLYARSGITRLF